eukprot:965479_1
MPSLALCLMTTSSLFVAHVISIAIHLTESPGNQIIPPEKVVVKEVVPRLSMFAQEETSFDVQESEIGVEQPESEIVRVTSLTSGIYIADGGVSYCIAHYIVAEKDAHYYVKENYEVPDGQVIIDGVERLRVQDTWTNYGALVEPNEPNTAKAMNTINILGRNLSTQPPFERLSKLEQNCEVPDGQVIIDGVERLRVHTWTNYGALKEPNEPNTAITRNKLAIAKRFSELEQNYEVPDDQVIIDGAERLRVHDSRSNYGALKELSELEQLYEVPNGRAIINGALRDLFAYYYVKEEATAHTSNNDLKLGFILLIRAKHTDSLAALDRISLHMTHSLRSIASASTDSLDGNYIIIMRVFARKQRRICTAIQSR